MDRVQFKLRIPIELGDYVKVNNYNNRMKVVDIITIYKRKTDTTAVILQLQDIDAGWVSYFDFKTNTFEIINKEEILDEIPNEETT